MTHTVAFIVGSTSDDSLNRRLARAFVQAASEDMTFVEAPIDDLPFYKPEYDGEFPESGTRLKKTIADADGVLIITPEYNRMIPGVLKNALDWMSRPYGTNPLEGKPVMIAGASGGMTATAVAQAELRSLLAYFNAHLMSRPELYIRATKADFDESGRITAPGTQDYLAAALSTFDHYIDTVHA